MNEQKIINDEWELNNLTFIGKQLLTIFSFEENNIDNSMSFFIKEQLVSKKPKFKINNSSLLFTSFFLNNNSK